MRIIPVIDLLGGQVVRGVGGERGGYRPIVSQIAADASPRSVTEALVDRFGFDTVYVADLDAIERGRPGFGSWQCIADCGVRLWLDAGIGNSAAAAAIAGEARVNRVGHRLVIGLESLADEAELPRICEQTGDAIFSLDLKAGRPLTRAGLWQDLSPLAIASRVQEAGFRNLIVLDLADVGKSGGTRTLELCSEIGRQLDFREVIAGGGVRGLADLKALSCAGCAVALVASALHDGRLLPEELRRFAEERGG